MYQALRLHIGQCEVQILRKSIKKWVSNCSLKFWSQNFEKCGRARSHEKYNKHYLISIWNLIVEVDAHYIKGMLNNPDIDPSVTINHWILSILTFHFTLVHIPGTMHSPDGFSRCHAQPGNDPEPEDDFNNWVDQLYGFVHLVNPPLCTAQCSTTMPVYRTFIASPTLRLNYNEIEYSNVPHLPSTVWANLWLTLLVPWLTSLEQPPELPDSKYKWFVQFGMQFFYDHSKLWWQQTEGHCYV